MSLNQQDQEAILRKIPEVDYVGVRNWLSGEFTINYKDKNGSFGVFGCNPDFFKANGEKLHKGRMLNALDMRDKRKVVVIGQRVAKVIFGEQDPIGEYVEIRGIHFKVVGIFTRKGGNGRAEERVYMPFSAYQVTFNPRQNIHTASVVAKEGISAEVIDLRSVRPIDYAAVVASVKKTNRLVVVEEAWPLAAISSEIAYHVQRHAFDYLDAPIHRVNNMDIPLHYAPTLIEATLPNVRRTMEAVKAVMYRN
ncbi:MAG: hypothetical protein HC913_07040 [Microscillaceae bacterium]|nr:hypothetical protein [Microscillaceae bacterium]